MSSHRVLLFLRRLDCNDGVASYCESLMRGLITVGNSVHVVSGEVHSTARTIGRFERMEALAVSWLRMGNTGVVPTVARVWEIAKLVRKANVDIINVMGFGALFWGKAIALASGRPFVATYVPSVPGNLQHVVGADMKPFSLKQRFFLKAFAPTRIICLSEKSAIFVAAQCPSLSNRIDIIYGGIDSEYFCPPSLVQRVAARSALKLAPDDLACLLIGRMDWNKGHDLLIRAVQEVRNSTPSLNLRCFFVGSGHNEAEIEALATSSAADCKTFTLLGHVQDVRETIWGADIFVLPSRLEGFGLVVAEAMACGVVPIRTPSGGASDQIIAGENGVIVPFEDVGSMADAIRTLSDSTLRSTYAQRGVERSRTLFDQVSVARKVTALFDDLVRDAPSQTARSPVDA